MHPLIHLLNCLLILTDLSTCSFAELFCHSLIQFLNCLFTDSLTHPLIHLLSCLFIHSLIHPLIHLLNYPLIYSFSHLLIIVMFLLFAEQGWTWPCQNLCLRNYGRMLKDKDCKAHLVPAELLLAKIKPVHFCKSTTFLHGKWPFWSRLSWPFFKT